jgi:aconitate hydratase
MQMAQQKAFPVNHTYNAQQIEWFKAGGALNIIRRQMIS